MRADPLLALSSRRKSPPFSKHHPVKASLSSPLDVPKVCWSSVARRALFAKSALGPTVVTPRDAVSPTSERAKGSRKVEAVSLSLSRPFSSPIFEKTWETKSHLPRYLETRIFARARNNKSFATRSIELNVALDRFPKSLRRPLAHKPRPQVNGFQNQSDAARGRVPQSCARSSSAAAPLRACAAPRLKIHRKYTEHTPICKNVLFQRNSEDIRFQPNSGTRYRS